MNINSNLSLSISCLCFFAFLLDSCSENPKEPIDLKTRSGYALKVLDRTSDQKATESAYIMYRSDIMIGDTLINTSLLTAPYLFYEVKEFKEDHNVSPVVEAFQLMNDGDSVVLTYPMSSQENKPSFFGDAQALDYYIKIVKTLDIEEYGEEFRKIRDEMRDEAAILTGREEEMEEFTANVLQQFQTADPNLEFRDFGQGVKAIIHEEGQGPLPHEGAFVAVAYFGRLISTGLAFDNSFKRGKPFKYKLGIGTAIEGWDLVIPQLSKGTKATVFVPSVLGYDKQGFPPTIGPDEDLLFYIELVDIIK
ncbi:MAG: FKBP-type peptidyl-prolyl cis-trans isomerase [Bacteroidia bacterium]|nr:FKBP-type peptidyl-prolyl cis-trans isomerase [Bacteroidia bacterium]